MTATAVQSLAQLADTVPGILELAGHVQGRTLTKYRRDVSLYLHNYQHEGRDGRQHPAESKHHQLQRQAAYNTGKRA